MLANVCRQECTRHKLHIGLVFIAIMIEIVACPWLLDVMTSNAANSKQRDKRGWNRAVLMGHLPKEIVYRSRPALRRLILESFLYSPSIRYGEGHER